MEQHIETITTELVHPVELTNDQPPAPNISRPFIEANTVEATLPEIRNNHIIPVFVKDNEPLISHAEFIEITAALVAQTFIGEHILQPQVRVSHPIKGRIPEAKDKAAQQLHEWEKTIYYERMAFVIEVPSIQSVIDGNTLSLTIGGVKAYNADNLYSRSVSDQHFKIFTGFKNKVCTNLCIWTDGFQQDIKVKSSGQLKACIQSLLESYNANYHLHNLAKLSEFSITEHQFAQLVGRCRMYPHLPWEIRKDLSPLLFGDQQINAVVKDFYRDESFCRNKEGNINLWRLYNLFTGANKSSYIDSFLEKSVNAYAFVEQIRFALEGKNENWYLN